MTQRAFANDSWRLCGKFYAVFEALALGDTQKPEAILPSLTPFTTERFLLLRQIVVNCFNLKEINSVHLNP